MAPHPLRITFGLRSEVVTIYYRASVMGSQKLLNAENSPTPDGDLIHRQPVV